jgi:hypothetical protein
MGDRDDRQAIRRSIELVTELEAMNVEVDYDVMRIGPRTWAIHGRIAYDSEIIAATFPSEHDAWVALSPLRPPQPSPRRRRP